MLDVIPTGPGPALPRARGPLRWVMALLLAALPILSCGTALGLYLQASAARERTAELSRKVETLSLAIEAAVATGLRALEALAASHRLEARELAGFRDEARRLLMREPTWHTIALFDGPRLILDLRFAPESTLAADSLPVGPALVGGRPAVAALPDGRILLSVPVRTEAVSRGVLVAVLEAAALAGPLGRIGLAPDWSAVLLDGQGRRLAGGSVPSVPLATLGAVITAPDRPQPVWDGMEALARSVGETGWSVLVAAPPASLSPEAILWVALALLGAALSGAAGMSLALRGTHWRKGEATAVAAPPAEAPRRGPVPVAEPVPLAPRPASAGVAPSSIAPPPPASSPVLRVLVAEDVPASRLLLQALLQRGGHQVVAVAHGVEALEALRRESFDVGVLDLDMPRMDGLQAAVAIRALPPPAGRIPLLALTAERPQEVEARCRAAGFDAVLGKPVSSRGLLALIENLLAATTGQPPDRAAAAD